MTAALATPSPSPVLTVAPIPLPRLFAVEWSKATDTRAARWLLGLTAVASVLVLFIPLIAKHKLAQTFGNYLDFPSIALTTLLPVVSILTLTSEWTQRTVLTTFTQEPRRARVIGAKVAVSAAMALVAAVFGGLVALGGVGIADALGRHVHYGIGAAHLIGYGVFILLNILMAVAFGALLHNTSAAIVMFFVVPTAFSFLGFAWSWAEHWLDPGTVFNYALDGKWAGHAGPLAVCTVLWVLLPLAGGIVRTVRREIK
jgi:ABC-2 type transport system permease protein